MSGRPRVTAFSTASVDGRLWAQGAERLSCPHDLRRLHSLRASSDAVMVGATTVIVDDPSLTVRLVEGRNPLRVVVDGLLRSPPSSRVFDVSVAPTLVLTTGMAPRSRVDALRGMGVEVIEIGPGPRLDVGAALEILGDRGIRGVLVEGGGTLTWGMLSSGLLDELRVTISPMGLGHGPSLLEGPGSPVGLELVSHELCECGQEVHLIYRPSRG
ncbi:MAG: dihydrofolate reductase family protein [Conexivisphaera sp.]